MPRTSFWRSYGQLILVFTGILLGSLAGVVWQERITVLQPLGDLFLNLLFTIVVPLVFFAVASALCRREGAMPMGRLAWATGTVFLGTLLVAGILTVAAASIWRLPAVTIGKGAPVLAAGRQGVWDTVTGVLTVPEFYLLLSRKSMLALILFSVLMGVATAKAGEKGAPMARFLEAGNEVMKQLLGLIMYLAPLGLGAYFACQVGRLGPSLFGVYGQIMALFHGVSFFYYFVIFSLYALAAGGRKAVRIYWRNNLLPSATAIGTCSSIATIPANLEAAERMGIPVAVARLVVPLGGPLHKEGSMIASIVKVYLLFGLFPSPFPAWETLLLALSISVVVSIVEGGIPNGGYVGEILTISVFGAPPEALPPLILIGTLDDPIATLLNATGDTVSAMLVARLLLRRKPPAGALV